uniref:Uncharacterized protein n=1 Tax=Rhizophora mucronata TaxID=61149 RepID=A0A2P2NM92_RHIMU
MIELNETIETVDLCSITYKDRLKELKCNKTCH